MKKILLAENNAFLIKVYSGQLRKSGYETSVVLDGEAAISRIKNIKPDLLVLDVDLPKISSFSSLKAVKDDSTSNKFKVVLLANFEEEKKINNNFDSGITRCFIKAENTAEEVVEEIKKILS